MPLFLVKSAKDPHPSHSTGTMIESGMGSTPGSAAQQPSDTRGVTASLGNRAMTDQKPGYVTLPVRDYDEARSWYGEVLGFQILEDTQAGAERRIVLAPPGSSETRLLLTQISPERIEASRAHQLLLFLDTDDFWTDHDALQKRGVRFLETPRQESWGISVTFQDPSGNRWELLQSNPAK